MVSEDLLASWTGPASADEQARQDRTERMIREAVQEHAAFDRCSLKVYTKGSYPNNTNVRADSDVDVAVQCRDVFYWEEETEGAHSQVSPYGGIWTPDKLRRELKSALEMKFPGTVDSSGSTAFRVSSSSARVDADVVPCFDYRYYFSPDHYREGSRVFKKDGSPLVNYPQQQLEQGRAKNNRTSLRYKKAVRIMKRLENVMVVEGVHEEVPSFFVECLVYNCPDSALLRSSWIETVRAVIVKIWGELDGSEPQDKSARWVEANQCEFLFRDGQPWSRDMGRKFALAAWTHLGFSA